MRIEIADPLAERLATVERVVVFTGAGVSRESGLATFRDADGVWARHRPEEVATPEAFAARPATVWRFYAQRFEQLATAEPNPAHRAIARSETRFPSWVVVTQNVDGLHERAGSRDLLELHGTLTRARCAGCGERTPMAEAVVRSPDEPPVCGCGGRLRPDVVWFGEVLPEEVLARAVREAQSCDLLLSVGTSAQVFPAAGLIEQAYRAGAAVVEINPEETGFSHLADLRLAAPAGTAVPALLDRLAELGGRSGEVAGEPEGAG